MVKIPEELRQEIKEYLGLYDIDEDQSYYINKKFKTAEFEDPPEETAFKYMQEIRNAPFNGNGGLTKTMYAR